MFCRRCNCNMTTKMHFERGKNYQFGECPKCYFRTKAKTINYKQFETKEITNGTKNRKI